MVGGSETKGIVIRPVSKMEYLSYYPRSVRAYPRARGAGTSLPKRSPKRCSRKATNRPSKSGGGVGRPLAKCSGGSGCEQFDAGVSASSGREAPRKRSGGSRSWPELRMPGGTLHGWIRRGWVEVRRQESSGRWIVRADEVEVERLRRLRSLPMGHHDHNRWLEYASRRMASRDFMQDNT